MALSITVNGGGTFSASMEEGPVSFTASLGAVPGPKGDTGATGPAGVVAATAPIVYTSGTQTVSMDTAYFVRSPAVAGTDTQILSWDGGTSRPLWIDNQTRALFMLGTNKTGTTIAKGKAVYVSGATGNHPEITLAQANSELSSASTIGITAEEIANNGTGKVIVSGRLENVNTNGFAAGDTLFLSPSSAGGFTTTFPTQPNHGVLLGYVTRANTNTGVIEVVVKNYQELAEQSDVLLTSKTNNDLLAYESSSGLWKNKSFATLGLALSSDLSAYLTTSAAASTYAPLASPTFTGTVTIPGGASISGYLTTSSAASTYAPIASPTFTGTVTIPGGASISGFAPLASPALTGTPTAPTAAAATNTTQIATTAFVQQEVPAASTTAAGKVELATMLEAHTGSSTTLAVTPDDLAFRIHSGSTLYLTPSDSSATVSGGTTFTDSQGMGTRSGTASASYGMRVFAGNTTNGFNATVGNDSTVDFSKRAILSGKAQVRSASDAGNYAQRVQYGKTQTSTPIGNLGVKGFGIRSTGAGNALALLVHNGTTLTAVSSSFTPTASQAFDFQIHSDGAGNVTLYVNGSSVATSANGPTGGSGSLPCVSVETEATAAVSAAANSAFLVCNLRLSFDL
jgi:hypothetical protein